jgi:7,8-dihydro-6-hydroxymethylpterin-pyrophosphokinase
MLERAFVLAPLHDIAPEWVPAAALAAVADQMCVPLEESDDRRAC